MLHLRLGNVSVWLGSQMENDPRILSSCVTIVDGNTVLGYCPRGIKNEVTNYSEVNHRSTLDVKMLLLRLGAIWL